MDTTRRYVWVVVAAAAVGLFFSSFSTFDFVEHLDRQVHSVHCSFVPGLAAPDATGTSGCKATMMSRFSSFGRSSLWGGVPISLASMGVFAFLLFFALDVLWTRRERDRAATGLLAIATCVPAVASLVMGVIAAVELGVACKLCIGIYVASAVVFAGGVGAWWENRRRRFVDADGDTTPERFRPQPASRAYLGLVVAVGLLFVAVPALAYVSMAPDQRQYLSQCGTLDVAHDVYGVMIPVGERGDVPVVEVLDPLCPACRAVDARIGHADGAARLDRRLLLFPLDNACNWTLDAAVHPGACTVSEAMLCARDQAAAVMAWAFEHQEEIREASAADPRAARRMVVEAFPKLRGCVGSARARTRLNKSLRWAVRNRLPLLTPQLYLSGVRVCDADTDIGFDFALTALLEMHDAGELPKAKPLPRLETWRETPSEAKPEGVARAEGEEAEVGGDGSPEAEVAEEPAEPGAKEAEPAEPDVEAEAGTPAGEPSDLVEPTEAAPDEPVDEPTGESIEAAPDEPVDEPTGEPIEAAPDEPVDESAEERL